MPGSNVDYWSRKIERNKARDVKINAAYRRTGWKVIRIWEHRINDDLTGCILKIETTLLARLRRGPAATGGPPA